MSRGLCGLLAGIGLLLPLTLQAQPREAAATTLPVNSPSENAAEESQVAEVPEFVRGYMQQLETASWVDAATGDGRKVRLAVAQAGWGDARAQDVAAVCRSVAETVFSVMKPQRKEEPTIVVLFNTIGPMAVSQRGPGGEYFVLLNTRGRHWSQLAYQFAHELGHVLSGDRSTSQPQSWFEEAFCESMSLWALERMGETWRTNPPYAHWSSYASHLTDYAANVRRRVADVDDLGTWYREHRMTLDANCCDRDVNLVLAKWLADQAHAEPKFYQAFSTLRVRESLPTNSIEWVLANWRQHCPESLHFVPATVAEVLCVTPSL